MTAQMPYANASEIAVSADVSKAGIRNRTAFQAKSSLSARP